MTDRIALITGAAKRIGAAIAQDLARDGWHVIIHYHTSAAEAEGLAQTIAADGGQCNTIQADLSSREGIEGLIPRIVTAHGAPSVLINNASAFSNDVISTVTWESFHAQITPNLAAPLFLSRDFARALTAAEGGCIINLLDQKVGNLNPDFLSYTLSKVALQGLTTILAMAFGARIRVGGIAPGITLISGQQTEASFQRAWRSTPLGRSSTPGDIAAAVRFILDTPSFTGQTITLDGGESLQGRARDVAFDLPRS